MRIKAWVVTGSATVLAGTALGIVVATNDPALAGGGVHALFWASLFLGVWGALVTLALLARMNLARSVWFGLVWAVSSCGVLALRRAGSTSLALLGGIVLATLCLSVVIWRRFRHGSR